MINVSDAVKTAYINGNADTEIFLTIGETAYDPTNILAGSVSIEESLCSAEQFDLSRVEKNQLTFTLFNITENISDLQGLTVVAKQRIYPDPSDHTTYTDIPLGTYEIVEAVNDGDYLFKCTCYDKAMLAFDTNIDAWWNTTVTFPVTLRTLATDLFDYLNVDYDIPNEFTNSTFSIVKRTVYFEGVTAAELLGYIQEVAGGYFKADRTATIRLNSVMMVNGLYPSLTLYPSSTLYPSGGVKTFGTEDTAEQDYTYSQIVGGMQIADFETKSIERVQVRGTEDDIGIIVGTGENTYVIQGNPLLYNLTDTTGRPVVENILDQIEGFNYVPFSGKFIALPFVEVGDFAKIVTYKGLSINCPIFERTLSGSRLCFDTFQTKGTEDIEEITSVNRQLTTLNQKTHEIVNTVDELTSTVTNISTEVDGIAETVTEHTTQISQNANDITLMAKSYNQYANKLTNSNFSDLSDPIKFWDLVGNASHGSVEIVSDADFKDANGRALHVTKTNTTNVYTRIQYITLDGSNLKGKTMYLLWEQKLNSCSSSAYQNQMVAFVQYNTTSSDTFVNAIYNWVNTSSSDMGKVTRHRVSHTFSTDANVKQIRIYLPYFVAEYSGDYEINNLMLIIQESTLSVPEYGVWNDIAKTDLISQINIAPTGIAIQGEKIDIKGITTFSSASSGTTVIDGGTVNVTNLNASNITTGTLSGDRISGGTIDGIEIDSGDMYWNKGTANQASLIASDIIYGSSTYKGVVISATAINIDVGSGMAWVHGNSTSLILKNSDISLNHTNGATIVASGTQAYMYYPNGGFVTALGTSAYMNYPSGGSVSVGGSDAHMEFSSGGKIEAKSDGVYVTTPDYGGSTMNRHKVVWRTINGIWALCLQN